MVPITAADTKIGNTSITLPTTLVSPDLNPTIGSPTSTSLQTCSFLFADTGSTAHFCTINTPVINQIPATHPIAIRNPNGSIMHSTHLPALACQVHIVVALARHFLI
jgi:hypothetical protein